METYTRCKKKGVYDIIFFFLNAVKFQHTMNVSIVQVNAVSVNPTLSEKRYIAKLEYALLKFAKI